MSHRPLRVRFAGWFYRNLLKRIFFVFDAEKTHNVMVAFGRLLGKGKWGRRLTSSFLCYSNKKLEQNLLGINFSNPVGLAAGFDKNGQLLGILPALGFGFAEIGSVSGAPCAGNPAPHLWRLSPVRGLRNYYGLNNVGSEVLASHLRGQRFKIPFGFSIAKANNSSTDTLEAGIADYLRACVDLAGIADYLDINISCPNSQGGEPFALPENLDKLLGALDSASLGKPIFVKFSPDLTQEEVDKILGVLGRHQVSGIVCVNTSKNINNPKLAGTRIVGKGGLSGKVIEDLANDMIKYVYRQTRGRYVIIGCGGIFSAADAYQKIKLGASLVQLFTGLVYEGPQLVAEINSGLAEFLQRDGFNSIDEAVGADNKF